MQLNLRRVRLGRAAARVTVSGGWRAVEHLAQDWVDADRYSVARALRRVDSVAAAAFAAKLEDLRWARRWARRHPHLRAKTAAAVMLSAPGPRAMAAALCELGCEVPALASRVGSSTLPVWVALRRIADDAAAGIVATRDGSRTPASLLVVLRAWRLARNDSERRYVARFAPLRLLRLARFHQGFLDAWAEEAVANRAHTSLSEVCRWDPRLLLRPDWTPGLPRALASSLDGPALLARVLDLDEHVARSVASQFPGSLAELRSIVADTAA